MDTLIEISDFSLRISGQEILRDVNLGVRRGDYVSIVGPNGAGKTTLIRCMCRILTGGTGRIQVAGRPIGELSQRELARYISYVPQADGSASPFTVYEFVLMGRYPYFSPFSPVKKEDEAAVAEALALTGTERFAERTLGSLSGGERQKVFIAAALAQKADALLLDEPTTFLDPVHQGAIYGILEQARAAGVTIVSVTHDINCAVLTSERIVALREGRIAFQGGASELMDNAILEGIYGKRFTFMSHPETGRRLVAPEGPA